jgi:two-component system sensor histidine kinase DesK
MSVSSATLRKIFTPADNSLLRQYALRTSGEKNASHWMPALMLSWTFWLFFVPMFQTGDYFRNWMWPTLSTYAIFLWLYFRIYYRDRTQTLWCVLGMALLGFAVTPFNPGGQSYVIYACAYWGFATRMRNAVAGMVLLLALYSIEWLFLLRFEWVYLINAICVGLAVGFMNLNLARKYQREAELWLSHEEVRRLASTAERERIGRDLHDLLGHTLSLITLKSELANKLFDRDPGAAKREMVEVERVARDALAQVRRAVTGIRAAGVAAEIASGKLLLESNGVTFDYALADVGMPVEIETALAMTVREAVTNIQRHAYATRARATLETAQNKVVLRIEDNGRGGAIVPGNGLTGMRERLAAVGAQLGVDSQRGQGTRLTVTVTLPQAEPLPIAAREKAVQSAA